jgi:hypothetical protein
MKIIGLNFIENLTPKRIRLINKLFMEFSQMDNALTKNFGGALLGLAKSR